MSLETPKKSCEFCPPNGDKCGICGSSFSFPSTVKPSKTPDIDTPVVPVVFSPLPFIEQVKQSSSALKIHLDAILVGLKNHRPLTLNSRHTSILILAAIFGFVLISLIPIFEWRSQQFTRLAISTTEGFVHACLESNSTGINLRHEARLKFKKLSAEDIALMKAGASIVLNDVLEELGQKSDLTQCYLELNKLDILSICLPRVLEKAFDLRVQCLLANQSKMLRDDIKLMISECKLNLDELFYLYKSQPDIAGIQRLKTKEDWLKDFSIHQF